MFFAEQMFSTEYVFIILKANNKGLGYNKNTFLVTMKYMRILFRKTMTKAFFDSDYERMSPPEWSLGLFIVAVPRCSLKKQFW